MGGTIASAGLAVLLLAGGADPPISSFDDLGKTVLACLQRKDPMGADFELRFTLTQRGALAGRPMVATRPGLSMATRRALVAAVLDSLRRCTPFTLEANFAQAVSGRPLTLRVSTGGRAVVV